MKTTEQYLRDLEDKLCDKLVSTSNLEEDERFETKREMQKYNNGIAEAMKLIREALESNEFKSDLSRKLDMDLYKREQ